MSRQTSARLAGLLGILALFAAVVSAGITLLAVERAPEGVDAVHDTPMSLLMGVALVITGTVIATRRPGHLVGWSLLTGGLSVIGSAAGHSYAVLALLADPAGAWPAGRLALSLSGGLWTGLMASIFYLVILFPRGELPSRRWRPLARFVGVGFAVVYVVIACWPGEPDEPFQDFENVLAFRALEPIVALLPVLIAALLLSIAVAVINLFLRFRRSRGEEREQFRWLVAAACLVIITNLPGMESIALDVRGINLADVIGAAGFIGLPLSIWIAVLKYRLYDIDRIINRTLVYAVLTAGLAALYFGLVVGLQPVFRSFTGGNDLAIVITTLIVAALFLPARRVVQRAVDRRFNRRTYDAARTIDAFSSRLRQQIDLDTLRYELLAVIDETMQPSKTSLYLKDRNDLGTP
jgi:hypothetical protein